MTHIELLGPAVEVPMKAALVALPQLTHLAFSSEYFLPTCVEVLEAHKTLYVVVYFCSYITMEERKVHFPKLARDMRFPVVGRRSFVEDWYIAMDRGMYHWDRAETFIAKRRTGEIDRTFILLTSLVTNLH